MYHGSEIANKLLVAFINRSRLNIDSCVSSVAPSVIIEIQAIKEARIAAVNNRAVRLRYVTEITANNLKYCKKMLDFSEIRHLQGMKGNFEVADKKEYIAIATLQKAQPVPQLIFSNVPEIVQQQQFVFDSLWDRGVPAYQRITEIENNLESTITAVLTDYKEAENKEFEMIKKARNQIQIIYSAAKAFHIQENNGILELLRQKADQNKNLKISILVPLDTTIKKSLSLQLLNKSINKNIHIQNISSNFDIKIKLLIVDKKEILVMEIKHLEDQSKEKEKETVKVQERAKPAIGFSIFSNSTPQVLSYSSIFEIIYNQSLYSEQLVHQGEIKDEFINTAAHELRTPTQVITGYNEVNDDLFEDFLKNRKNFTGEQLEGLLDTL